MTILILFQQSEYRTFTGFYTQYVQIHLRAELPHLVSYQRFVEPMPDCSLLASCVASPVSLYLGTGCTSREEKSRQGLDLDPGSGF